MLVKFLQDEAGATAIEYAMIAAVIALVILVGVVLVGNAVAVPFNSVAAHLT